MPGDRTARRLAVALLTTASVGILAVAGGPSSTVVAAPATGVLTAHEPAPPQSQRPNIVLVMADDMRYDDLVFMPRVRRLVNRTGVSFENAFSPYPLCCPARASLLTGRAAHNHKVYWHHAPYGFGAFDDSFTIATALKRSGYQTGFLGKYLNGYGTQRSVVTGGHSHHYVPRGWTEWRAAVNSPSWVRYSGGPYNFFNTPYNVNGRVDAGHKGEYQTTTLGRMTRTVLDRFHRSRRPFFVFTSFTAPHQAGPREADDPPHRVRRSDGKLTHMPTTARPGWVRGRFDDVVTHASGVPADGGPTEVDVADKPSRFQVPELNGVERRALREVTRQRAEALYVVDLEVSRIIKRLKQTREWANTLFVFTSDNGFYLGEHRRRTGKVTAHEPSLRVPLLMTGPGVRGRASRFDPVTTMDLTATIADVAGVNRRFPYALDGKSVWPTVRHGDRGWDRPVLTEALYVVNDGQLRSWSPPGGEPFLDERGAIGIRTARYKLIRYNGDSTELYDLATDPNELTSLHDDPAYDAIQRGLMELWWQYKDCTGAACAAPLPGRWSSSPAQTRRVTQHLVAGRIARYGR